MSSRLHVQRHPLRYQKSEEVIDFMSGQPEMSDSSSLLGFIASPHGLDPSCSHGFDSEDNSYEKAISECHLFRESPQFVEGVLLKCTDKKPLFPYLHFCHFQSQDHSHRIREINDCIRMCSTNNTSLYGSYDEVYSIQKTATVLEQRLPTHRHAGYIVVGFKLLDDATKQQNLERTWLSWSGAREIYKYSPRSWNLRRISLLRHPTMSRNDPMRPFIYVLMCEYGSILHPSNTIQAMDMCERLRVRNCGHIALYQVHTAYNSSNTTATNILSESTSALSSSSSSSPPRRTTAARLTSTSSTTSQTSSMKRNPMMRGLSQDVETHSINTVDARRNRLRLREKSFQYPDDHYHTYHY
ncbi:unnamed protein product [Auanema sp. JU1783]|nr:unnamed protein product [Auanema sp. JU1783]